MDLCPLGVRTVRVGYAKEDTMTVDDMCVFVCVYVYASVCER